MKDWRAAVARIKGRLNAAWVGLKAWSATTWPRLVALARAHRDRLVPAAGLLGVSLALFIVMSLVSPSPAQRVGQRYLDAAFAYDYMGLYGLFDPQVLEGELERYGLDRSSMAALAQTNSRQVERYVADIQRQYAVEISYTYRITGERSLEPGEWEALTGRYAADGFSADIRDARRVSALVSAALVGDGSRDKGEWELELTAIATPRGWSLDRDSMYAFLDVLYAMPGLAQSAFGR